MTQYIFTMISFVLSVAVITAVIRGLAPVVKKRPGLGMSIILLITFSLYLGVTMTLLILSL